MSTVNLTINVDDNLYKNFLEKEIEAFSKEELHLIAKSVIEQILIENKNNIIESLFLETQYTRYDSAKQYRPTELLRNAAKQSIDISPAFDEIKEEAVKYLKENYREILVNCFVKLLADSLIQSSGSLHEILQTSLISFYNNTRK